MDQNFFFPENVPWVLKHILTWRWAKSEVKILFKSLSENQKIPDGRHKNRNIAKNETYVEKYELMNMCMEFEQIG